MSVSGRHMMSLTGPKACMGILPCGRGITSSWTGTRPGWTTLPPCSTLKPARSGFRRVSSSPESDSCPIPGLAEDVLEMRVKEGSKIRNLLGFAMARMLGGVQHGGRPALKQILFTGSGRAITKTITCAEIMKRQLRGLHQMSKLQYRTVREQWEGRDSTSSRMTIHRMLPAIYILLSKEPLDPNEPGYQPPVELDACEPGYQLPVELDSCEPSYQHPGVQDLNEPDYQRPVELDQNKQGCQPPVGLQTVAEYRKPDEHLHSLPDPQSMLGYHPPVKPFPPSHPRRLPSQSFDSQSENWPSGVLASVSDCSEPGHQSSPDPCPQPHPHWAGEELCIREGMRSAHPRGSRKRHAGSCSLPSQPSTKAARFDEGIN